MPPLNQGKYRAEAAASMEPRGEPATVIVSSTTDLASATLARALVEEQGFRSTGVELEGKQVFQKGSLILASFEGMIVFPPDLDALFNPLAYVFLSRHSAESGIASLTAHSTGNFTDEAKFGGGPRELGRSDPSLLKNYLTAVARRRGRVPGYEVTMEATHHGPTALKKPVLFVELGSSEEYWGDKGAASVVGEALVESLSSRTVWEKAAIGFGGTHYPEKFTKLVVEGEFAVSFVAPKYALEHVDERMFGQMLQKTTSPVRYALLDWKGLGAHKDKIVSLAAQFGLEVVRV
jgi:D-aminoacyl-tRNA deacylase